MCCLFSPVLHITAYVTICQEVVNKITFKLNILQRPLLNLQIVQLHMTYMINNFLSFSVLLCSTVSCYSPLSFVLLTFFLLTLTFLVFILRFYIPHSCAPSLHTHPSSSSSSLCATHSVSPPKHGFSTVICIGFLFHLHTA